MRLKSKIAWVMAVGIIAQLAGCTGDRIPRVPVKNTKGFSLGGANLKPFERRPTAQELHDAVVALYTSFDSIAATIEVEYCSTGTDDSDEQEFGDTMKYRYCKPDRDLVSSKGSALVRNRGEVLWYMPDMETYCEPESSTVPERRPHLALEWFGLVPDTSEDVESMRLLSDASIAGEKAYVLEIKTSASKYSKYETRLFYLAKEDLLPRKIVRTGVEPSPDGDGTMSYKRTETITSFRANEPLDERLFDTTPPRGANKGETRPA